MKIDLKCKCGAEATFEDNTNKWLIALSLNMGKWINSHDKCLGLSETTKKQHPNSP